MLLTTHVDGLGMLLGLSLKTAFVKAIEGCPIESNSNRIPRFFEGLLKGKDDMSTRKESLGQSARERTHTDFGSHL